MDIFAEVVSHCALLKFRKIKFKQFLIIICCYCFKIKVFFTSADKSREVLYTVLSVCAGIGTLALFFLRKPPEKNVVC